MRVGVAAHPQGGPARRRGLRGEGIVHEAPAPFVRHARKAGGEAVAADAHELVDRGHAGTADQVAHLGGAGLQRLGGVVHGRGADTHHRHPLALQRGKIDLVRGVRPEGAVHPIDKSGDLRRAGAVAARGHHQLARQDRTFAAARQVQAQQIALGFDLDQRGAVFHRDVQHAAVPAQIVHSTSAAGSCPAPASVPARSARGTRPERSAQAGPRPDRSGFSANAGSPSGRR
jgi:hypothetical protein